jgi:hypothetical protein
MMRAGAFVRRSGADGLGHVGWSFQYADGSYCDGAVENPAGKPVSPPGQTGFWSERVVDPDGRMQLLKYDAFKLFEIEAGESDLADKTVAWIATQPYILIMRNCMDDTYDVLRSYGIPNLPLPMIEITPNRWFDQLSPVAQLVSTQALHDSGLAPTSTIQTARPPSQLQPGAPLWRIPGSAEWQAFHESLLTLTMETRSALQFHGTGAPAVNPPH